MKKTIVFFILSLSIYTKCNAQTLLNNTCLMLNTLSGYSFAPNVVDKTNASLDGFVKGFEFGITKITNGKKDWQQTFGCPRIGISLQTILMNKPDTFGYCVSLLPNIELRFFSFKKSELSGKVAIGAAYASKAFNRQTNFDNRAISTPINFALSVAAIYHHKLSNKIDLNIEAGFYHLSNGSFKLPNGGFNIYYSKLGINYFFNQNSYEKRTAIQLKTTNKKIYYNTYFAFAYREQGTFDYKRQYPIFTWHQAILKPLNKVYNLGIGLDFFYDATQALLYNEFLIPSQIKQSDKYLVALGICNELRIGKLALPLHFYHYIYNLDVVKQPIYLRFGLGYYPIKNIYLGCFFKGSINKNNSLESDFMEFALGYKIARK